MGFVSFVLVVGGLGFAVWLVLAALKRHDELLVQQNQMLAQLLGYKPVVPEPAPQPPVAVGPAPGWSQPWDPSQPVQATPEAQGAAYWAQR